MRRKTSDELNKLRCVSFNNDVYYFSERYPVFAASKKLRLIRVKKRRGNGPEAGELYLHPVVTATPLTWIDAAGVTNEVFKSRVIADIFMFNDGVGILTDDLPRKWAEESNHADELPEDFAAECFSRTKLYKLFEHGPEGKWLTATQVAKLIIQEKDISPEEFGKKLKKLQTAIYVSHLRARADRRKKIRVYGRYMWVN